MLNNLPIEYRKDQWVIDLFHAIQLVDDEQRAEAVDIVAQQLLNSMTWILSTIETELGIVVPPGASIEDRRAAIAAKWRSGARKCDVPLIKELCELWSGVEADVQYNGFNVIGIILKLTEEAKDNLWSICQALRGTIPAHMRFSVTALHPIVNAPVYVGCATTFQFSREKVRVS